MFKKILSNWIIFLPLFFLFACNSEPAPVKETKPKVGLLIFDNADVFISNVTQEIKNKFGSDVDLRVADAKNDQSLQGSQLRTFIDEDVDFIIMNAVTPTHAPFTMDLVKKANIPMIFFNREPDVSVMKTYGNMVYVGTNAAEAGIMQGQLIDKLWKTGKYDRNGDNIFQYVMLCGDPDNPEAMARTINSVQHAKELGVNMAQIGGTSVCDWSREIARETVKDIMLSYADNLEIIIANNDSMALGAVDTLQEYGYNKGDENKVIPVIGVDAIAEALIAVEKGFLSGTVKQDHVKMAEVITTLTLNKLNGKEFLDGVDKYVDSSGVAVRIPYSVVE